MSANRFEKPYKLRNIISSHDGLLLIFFSHLCGLVSRSDVYHQNIQQWQSGWQERTFWNTSIIEMKFSIERSWIKSVRSAKNKPNYGMTNMDSLLEEVIGNKLEMCDLLIDSYLKEIGKAIGSKLSRSKATSLANPVILFVPWPVFCHVPTLARGYSGDTTALSPSPLDFHAEKEL